MHKQTVQIYIASSENAALQYINLGITPDRYNVKLVGLVYNQIGNSDHTIRIYSPNLMMRYGNVNYYTFKTKGFESASLSHHIYYGEMSLSDPFAIQLIDATTLGNPSDFTDAIITLELEKCSC